MVNTLAIFGNLVMLGKLVWLSQASRVVSNVPAKFRSMETTTLYNMVARQNKSNTQYPQLMIRPPRRPHPPPLYPTI